jgi:hypothetical protein
MSLLTRKETYNWLKVILKDGFYKDDSNMYISVNKKLTEDDMDSLTCSFVNLLGNSEIPHPQNHFDKKVLMSQFRINSHFIDVDNNTLGINKYGQLQVNVDALVDNDNIVKALIENKAFLDKIREYLDPGELSMDWVEVYLLKDPKFIKTLTALITVIQQINEGKLDSTVEKEIDKRLIYIKDFCHHHHHHSHVINDDNNSQEEPSNEDNSAINDNENSQNTDNNENLDENIEG